MSALITPGSTALGASAGTETSAAQPAASAPDWVPGLSPLGGTPPASAAGASAAAHVSAWSVRAPRSASHTASARLSAPLVGAAHASAWSVRIGAGAAHDAPWRLHPDPLSIAHAAPWRAMPPARACHAAPFGMLARISAAHAAVSGGMQPVRAAHLAPSSGLARRSAAHAAVSGGMQPVRAAHLAPSSGLARRSAAHAAVAGGMQPARAAHRADWRCLAAIAAAHRAPASLRAQNWTSAAHRAPASMPDAEVEILLGPNTLIHAAGTMPVGEATALSLDSGSAVWIAEIELLRAEDYARVRIGDALELVFWGEPIALVCDGRRLSRGEGAPGYVLSAVSPAALLGSSWSAPRVLGQAGMARAAVESLLGQAVDWRLPDWGLPSAAVGLEGTPLELARQIVGAVGGLLESAPDGSLSARPAYPVSPPDWGRAPVTDTLTERHLLSATDRSAAAEAINRVVITSGDIATDHIEIETERDPEDAHHVTVRAYPWPWRPVELVHTGDAATQIGPRAERETEHDELIEILAGQASARYPVHRIDSARYQYADLGALRTDGAALTTASPEYSLLAMRYRARCWEWSVTNARDETIQFLAMECHP